jgi:hypothetical protein
MIDLPRGAYIGRRLGDPPRTRPSTHPLPRVRLPTKDGGTHRSNVTNRQCISTRSDGHS